MVNRLVLALTDFANGGLRLIGWPPSPQFHPVLPSKREQERAQAAGLARHDARRTDGWVLLVTDLDTGDPNLVRLSKVKFRNRATSDGEWYEWRGKEPGYLDVEREYISASVAPGMLVQASFTDAPGFPATHCDFAMRNPHRREVIYLRFNLFEPEPACSD